MNERGNGGRSIEVKMLIPARTLLSVIDLNSWPRSQGGGAARQALAFLL